MSKLNDVTKIPISVLEVLKVFKEKKNSLFESITYSEGYIKYQGKGINDVFFFSIDKHEISQGKVLVDITFSPTSKNSISTTKKKVTISDLEIALTNWSTLLQKYKELSTTFNENEKFEQQVNEIYEEFQFTNSDQDKFFNVSESIQLDDTLETLTIWLDENKEKFLPVLYQEIKSEIRETQENFQDNQKSWAAKKIAKILALIMKQGPRFLKETAVEVTKSTISELIKAKLLGM